MATKKKTAAPAAHVPNVLVSEEGNKSIARAKAALAKKWSLTRAESLEGAVELAWFLVALGRAEEARELVDPIVEGVTFSDDPKLWSAAANAIALAARLARLSADEVRRAGLVARLVEHPAVAREAFAKWLSEAQKDLRSAEVETAQKWACQGFARGCARAAYGRETAAERAYEAAAIDAAALELVIAEGLAGLRAYLAR